MTDDELQKELDAGEHWCILPASKPMTLRAALGDAWKISDSGSSPGNIVKLSTSRTLGAGGPEIIVPLEQIRRMWQLLGLV